MDIEEQVNIFREQLTMAKENSGNPEGLRWAIFPTGDAEIEKESVMAILNNQMENIELLIFASDMDTQELVSHLRNIIEQYDDDQMTIVKRNAEASDFEMKLGTPKAIEG